MISGTLDDAVTATSTLRTAAAACLSKSDDWTPPLPTIPTPAVPFEPPKPLPKPRPDGNPGFPFAATLTPCLPSPVAGIPLGSPKPPVWTCAAGFAVVGITLVGCANVFVATTLASGAFGICGRLRLDATLISGAF